jgi:hypothetical protein
MVDQGFDAFQKPHRVREPSVILEGRLIFPPGMNVEQARIAYGAEDVNAKATGFLSRWFDNLTKGVRDVPFLTGTGMEPCKDKKLHCDRSSRTAVPDAVRE